MMSKVAGTTALAAAVTLGISGDAFAWQSTWKTTGKTQTTKAHSVKKGKHFLHFGIYGNGRTAFTAKAYKRAKGKDPLIQTIKGKDNGTSWMADWKKYGKGDYYVVFNYKAKNKKAFGGIQ
ncbi:hypothetical protein [Streptomyces sp. RKAG290]|uniref:hypothetical protein n=1 Tax=Streptomyces sp. RKAG290 TaxID=2888348 RepID=UPI002033459A|nr:hypothetical protein [Streptomyces sp. RKAG290]MCM2413300.1 hypothetical protein [Streptomyces sp. RKAG290]